MVDVDVAEFEDRAVADAAAHPVPGNDGGAFGDPPEAPGSTMSFPALLEHSSEVRSEAAIAERRDAG